MLTIWSGDKTRFCDGIARRDFLRVGALGLAGLSLADLLRLRSAAGEGVQARRAPKAVIMIYLFGGPSHIDMYDLKPDAPAEYRGEFKPIRSVVPGFDICEHLPLQAKIADKLALIRNMKFNPNAHDPVELFSGFRKPAESSGGVRPDLGSVVSKLRSGDGPHVLPSYITLDRMAAGERGNGPAYLGLAHKPFLAGEKLEGLALARGITLEQLDDRRALLASFDHLRRGLDQGRGDASGMDAFQAQALAMITSAQARDAFDVAREPEPVRAKYGEHTRLLRARRLVEAGVPVVTLTMYNVYENTERLGWDTHEDNFTGLQRMLPRFDQGIHALITDIHERGLDKDVAVVIWGEMGRAPKITTPNGKGAGRDHWPQSGFALLAGGGLHMGQVIGATTARAELPRGNPYTPQNVLATLYHVLGIDAAATTLPDHNGRPIYLLDTPEKVAELV